MEFQQNGFCSGKGGCSNKNKYYAPAENIQNILVKYNLKSYVDSCKGMTLHEICIYKN